MSECPKCHRTGFSDEELTAHNGTPCEPLSGRALRDHLTYDVDLKGRSLCVIGASLPAPSADDKKAIADLQAQVAALLAAQGVKPGGPAPGGA